MRRKREKRFDRCPVRRFMVGLNPLMPPNGLCLTFGRLRPVGLRSSPSSSAVSGCFGASGSLPKVLLPCRIHPKTWVIKADAPEASTDCSK